MSTPTVELQRVLRQIRRDCEVMSGLALDALLHAHRNNPTAAIDRLRTYSDDMRLLAQRAAELVAPNAHNEPHKPRKDDAT